MLLVEKVEMEMGEVTWERAEWEAEATLSNWLVCRLVVQVWRCKCRRCHLLKEQTWMRKMFFWLI